MLENKTKNNKYSLEFKNKAVEMYLSGKYGGINTLTKQLGMKSHSQIKSWIAKYKEAGIEGLESKTGKAVGLRKGRPKKTSLSKDEEILKLRAENEYLKGMLDISNKNIKKEQFLLIQELSNKYSLKMLFEISNIKKSTYYKWLKSQRAPTLKQLEDVEITNKIKQLFIKHKGRYGVDRMTHTLAQDFNTRCNRKRTYRLMKESNCLAVIKAKKKYNPCGQPHPKHNVLKRNFSTSCPFDKIATDITEVKDKNKKVYNIP